MEEQNLIEKINHKIENKIESIAKLSFLIILVVLIIGLIFTTASTSTLNAKVTEIKEANRPAEINLAIIKPANCPACFDTQPIITDLKQKNVKILNENTINSDSEKAKQLISDYNIQKLPAVIITGETNKTNINGFENIKNALIFNQIKPLYLNIQTNEIIGEVSIEIIKDSSCKTCVDLFPILETFGQTGVKITDLNQIEYSSKQAKDLILKYNIQKIPAMIISSEIEDYDIGVQLLAQLNAKKSAGSYVISAPIPPYKNAKTGEVEGNVDLIMLTDDLCTNCYDVEVNKQILAQLGIIPVKENKYDISSSEGKELISKYNIKKVPVIILSPQASAYDNFVQAWKQIGSKETDGWFVMRKPEVIGEIKEI